MPSATTLNARADEMKGIAFGYEECPEVTKFIQTHITLKEARSLWTQLANNCEPDRQLLWTGVLRCTAESWAKAHGLQTLSMALGPYMDRKSDVCPKKHKSDQQWTEYMHAASALFSWYICKGEHVVLLCGGQPPERFHPSGNTSFQCIEAPIIMGKLGNHPVGRIDIVHPLYPGSIDFTYQFWPTDQVSHWVDKFGGIEQNCRWRSAKKRKPRCNLANIDEPAQVLSATGPPRGCPNITLSQKTRSSQSGNKSISLSTLNEQHKCKIKRFDAETSALKRAMGDMLKQKRKALNEERSDTTANLKGKLKRARNKQFDEMSARLGNKHAGKLTALENNRRSERFRLIESHQSEIMARQQAQSTSSKCGIVSFEGIDCAQLSQNRVIRTRGFYICLGNHLAFCRFPPYHADTLR